MLHMWGSGACLAERAGTPIGLCAPLPRPLPVAVARSEQSMSGLLKLLLAGLLFGAGGPVGDLLVRAAGLSTVAVAGYRLILGGVLIVIYLMCTGRRLPRGRPAWIRIVVIAGLSALCQGCYFTAAGRSSVSTAVLITIGAAPVLVLVAERVSGRRAGDRRLI